MTNTQNPALDPKLDQVEAALLSIQNLKQKLLDGVARAVDEVVDPVRSGRWTIDDLDQPEKTVIGIRVENILRMELELQRSEKLDIRVANEDVDIKFTIGSNWAIPPEASNEICLLTSFNEKHHTVSAGILRITPEARNPGKNRDLKTGISKLGKQQARWFLTNEPVTNSILSFMHSLDNDLRKAITDTAVGAQIRQNRLFSSVQYTPIPESLVEAISHRHRDWSRRLRPDARNPIAPGGSTPTSNYDVLRQSSAKDRAILKQLGLTELRPGFCLAIPL